VVFLSNVHRCFKQFICLVCLCFDFAVKGEVKLLKIGDLEISRIQTFKNIAKIKNVHENNFTFIYDFV